MQKGQTSLRDGVQDCLCPFPYLGITQYSRIGSHLGTSALDIGYHYDKYEPYYAPCDIKCVWIYPEYGQSMWQSINKVRIANDSINYVTFVTAHDSSLNAHVGQVIRQGQQWGNKGDKGASGQWHCHIEGAIGLYTFSDWKPTGYFYLKNPIHAMPNEIDLDSVFFCDGTVIDADTKGDWKYTNPVISFEQPRNLLCSDNKIRFFHKKDTEYYYSENNEKFKIIDTREVWIPFQEPRQMKGPDNRIRFFNKKRVDWDNNNLEFMALDYTVFKSDECQEIK